MPDRIHTLEEPTPFYDFAGLKNLLRNMGYRVDPAVGYRPIQTTDIGAMEIRNNIVMRDDGIFYRDIDGELRKIFMYKRSYHLRQHGKPRFHIRKCEVINDFISKGALNAEYRGANVATVNVKNRDFGGEETPVSELPLCRYCQAMASDEFPTVITSEEFVERLQEEGELLADEETEVNLWGFTKDWAGIKSKYLKKINYTCESCGAVMKSPFDHHFLRVYHINKKKTDNRDANLKCVCPSCYFNETNERPSKADEIIIQEYGKFILQRYLKDHDYTCELCKTKITNRRDYHYMHIRHKNGNESDFRLKNLQCVCPHCWYNVKTTSFTQQEWNEMREFIAKYKHM